MSRPQVAAAAALSLALAVAAVGAGCARKQPAAKGIPPIQTTGSALYGTFVRQDSALLEPKTPVTALYNAGDAVYVYTRSNQVYSLSGGLDIRYIAQVAPPTETIRRPVQVADETIFPTSVGLEVYTAGGEKARTVRLPHPLTSDVRVDPQGKLVAGTAAPTGGRVAVLDPSRTFRPMDQSVLLGPVLSAPVSSGGALYAANEKGEVFAISPDSSALWQQLPGKRFSADRSIKADLVADEYAIYVASLDTKLYALDRNNGSIKWRYMAQVPLREAPFVTKDRVFQIVPGSGLVAINKTEGSQYREPLWTAQGVTKVLSVDDKYVYAVQGKDRLVALGLADGKEKFAAEGAFDYFTAGPNGAIYAANKQGAVVSLKRGPYLGEDVAATR